MATVNTMIDTSISEGGSLKSDPNSELTIDVTPGSVLGQIKLAVPAQREIPKLIKLSAPAQREVPKLIKLFAPAQREVPKLIKLSAPAQREIPKLIKLSAPAQREVPKRNKLVTLAQRENVPKRIKLAAPGQRKEVTKRIKLAAPGQRKEVTKPIKLAAPGQRKEVPKRIKLVTLAQREEVPKRIKLVTLAQREEVPKRIKLVTLDQIEEVTKRIKLAAPAQREEILKEVISVKSDKDLLLRTTIDKYGKKIEFWAAKNYKGFTGKIGVTFPPCSVLGEEKVFLEIVPESFVHSYNETSKKLKCGVPAIITPILHIDRENDTSFLRDVEVSFPVFPKFRKILEKCQSSEKLLVENGQILLRESKFCPKAVGYYEVEGILQALRVDTDFNLAFRKLGVYLLVEQVPENAFLFDLRPFRDEEEHRVYRIDEKKTFRMIINPQLTDSSIYGTGVSITVQEPVVVHNNNQFRNVKGNEIKFFFPDPQCDIDSTNKRKVTVEAKGLGFFKVQFHFESPLLDQKGIDGEIRIPLYSEEQIRIFSTRRFGQSKEMLLEFLKCLNTNWVKFLTDYLGVEMKSMKEFIEKDIRLSLLPSVLTCSEGTKKQLKRETGAPEFQEMMHREQLVETMLKNYKSSNDLLKAKVEIFANLKKLKVLASETECIEALHQDSREVLATALMYIRETQLREAMKAAFNPGKLFPLTPDVQKFIYHSEELMEWKPDGH